MTRWSFVVILWWMGGAYCQDEGAVVGCLLSGRSLSMSGGFTLDNISDMPCTHIIYKYADLQPDTVSVHLTPTLQNGAVNLINYRDANGRKVKAMLQLGGDETDSPKFSDMVSTPEKRDMLAQSIIKLITRFDFDGVHFHWKHPGINKSDKTNYMRLGQVLKKQLTEGTNETVARQDALLSLLLPNTVELISGFNLMVHNAQINFFFLPAYDYVSDADPLKDAHSPVSLKGINQEYPYRESSAEFITKLFIRIGAVVRKIILGIPLYGRMYTLDQESNITSTQTIPYNQLCGMLNQTGWKRYGESERTGPFASKDNQVISYNDPQTIKAKVILGSNFGIGGVMFESLEMDDWQYICPADSSGMKRNLPLVRSAVEAQNELEPSSFNRSSNPEDSNKPYLWEEKIAQTLSPTPTDAPQVTRDSATANPSSYPIRLFNNTFSSASGTSEGNYTSQTYTFRPITFRPYAAYPSETTSVQPSTGNPSQIGLVQHYSSSYETSPPQSYSTNYQQTTNRNQATNKGSWYYPPIRIVEAADDIVIEDISIRVFDNNWRNRA